MYYVYEWFIEETGEIFHVGKGKNNRMFDVKRRNKYFKRIINKYKCNVRIFKNGLTEEQAWQLEKDRIFELKKIGQASTNFHEGGKGGNSFKYLPTNELDIIKNKIGQHSKNKWKDQQTREKIVSSIQKAMKNENVKQKISNNTKKAMQKPDVIKHHLEKVSQPVILKYKNGTVLKFDTNKEFRQFIAKKYNASTKIVYKLLNGKPFELSTRSKKTLKDLEGAIAYREKDLLKSVETKCDECSTVE